MTRFQDLPAIRPSDIEAAIDRNDPDEMPLVPITVALLSPDHRAAAEVCVRLAAHPAPKVRANALSALGHLARRFRQLDEERVRPIIEAGLRDETETVRSHAKSAADEVHQFQYWTIEGHRYG